MSKYDEMSDFEVNERLQNLDVDSLWIYRPDYCNNWSDIGPLIEQHLISIVKLSDGYLAVKHEYIDVSKFTSMRECAASGCASGMTVACHENPKRAAAICIINLLELK